LFGVAVADSLVDVVAPPVGDEPADFFGRPRFLPEPSPLVVAFGFDADFFPLADPDGRPRFFVDVACLGAGAATTGALTTADPDGRPRFFFSDSATFSFS
jgi:hypothetical protein